MRPLIFSSFEINYVVMMIVLLEQNVGVEFDKLCPQLIDVLLVA